MICHVLEKEEKEMAQIKKNWALIITGLLFLIQVIVMYAAGESVYASTHDNLDLHILDYHLLAENKLFFGHGGVLPVLDGVSRDYFFSEWSAYSWLYMILPTHYAYITGYLLKTAMGVGFTLLLAKYVLKERYQSYRSLLWLAAYAFGSLPLYSAFSWYFVSVPLVIYLVLRIYETPHFKWYLALFFYPLLSYFVFFGVFILGYLLLTAIIVSIYKKKFCKQLFAAVVVLFAGYAVMEYRLFSVMLFSDVITIRDTMVLSDWSIFEVFYQIGLTFREGIFHAQACQKWFVFPICMIGLIVVNAFYIRKKEYKKIYKDPFNLTMMFILFNCLVYGFYGFKPLRSLIESLVPVITGLQLNRTVFFNTFLWYAALFFLMVKVWDTGKKKLASVVMLFAIFVVMITPERYNDFYNTCFNHFYELVKGTESNNLDFGEYYSVPLMEEIKADIDYNGEKCVAYGINPAVLEYSNIWTLDGCISYYPQEYKEEFRKLIAPALEKNASSREYYDDWGARAYIYTASDDDIYAMQYKYEVQDKNLYMDMEQFKKMGGTYIFSRIEIANTAEKELALVGTYTNEESPYTIYLYKVRG